MTGLQLDAMDAKLIDVFRNFRTCEFTTLAKDGTPVSWPIEPYFQADKGRFLLTTTIGLPYKVFNIRRNPHVSLLFSYPIGSSLVDAPAVLVQGTATAPDEIYTNYESIWTEMRTIASRQTMGNQLTSNAIMRYLFDWFAMRLLMYVTPVRIVWWERGDFSCPPMEVEVNHVVG